MLESLCLLLRFWGRKNGDNERLVINDLDDVSNGTWFFIEGENEKTFFTDNLEEKINFYNPVLNLSVEAKLTEGNPPKRLNLEFGYFTDSPGGDIYVIGEGEVFVESNSSSEVYWVVPSITIMPVNKLKGFYYTIEGLSTGGVNIKVNVNGNTKAEVIGVVP